ncbi:type II toxin-antitoxin system prevent-host-death family antitoxin [Rhizobiales bacterium RZME27]|uniref:Antitoxin n=1 Tax=Endobacterium cereale TaxID=2663029 RepID=A0A6A8A1F5_9HYPH|nr:type II toxin-antitoxin system prevent-host-death family antitoxin [Endobacterium cereale]MEB2844808.1 type II toxin-antitoxin system prevent-host-death family antitoxin [Endobacterium cereale]MQY44725.1 type II toxin-antitoxin system prevent-host-death family antitoxin [Endobacterium cereale]
MKTVNIQEAQKDLVRLLEKAAKGEPFVVAQEGKPSLKVVTVEEVELIEAPKKKRRIGFLEGQFSVPDNFDTMFAEEIEEMFYGKSK